MKRIKDKAIDAGLSVAAVVYRRRPGVLDWIGWVCLVVAAAQIVTWAAWAVAGLGLLIKAADVERSSSEDT